MKNPIPFNPEAMTARQLFDCADTLSQIFTGLGRLRDMNDSYDDLENFLFHIEQGCEQLGRKWAK